MNDMPQENAFGPAARLAMARRADADAAAAPSTAAPGGLGISFTEGALMIGVALAFDGLQALLDVSLVGSPLASAAAVPAWLTFFLWFKMKGASFGLSGSKGLSSNSRPLIALAAGLGLEIIPMLNALPVTTASVIAAIATAPGGAIETTLAAAGGSSGVALPGAGGIAFRPEGGGAPTPFIQRAGHQVPYGEPPGGLPTAEGQTPLADLAETMRPDADETAARAGERMRAEAERESPEASRMTGVRIIDPRERSQTADIAFPEDDVVLPGNDAHDGSGERGGSSETDAKTRM